MSVYTVSRGLLEHSEAEILAVFQSEEAAANFAYAMDYFFDSEVDAYVAGGFFIDKEDKYTEEVIFIEKWEVR